MHRLTAFVRSLGNHGAVANVRAVLDARQQEDWVVQGLAGRLASGAAPLAAGGAVVARAA